MTEIKVGGIYFAYQVKKGESKMGPYEVLIVKANGKRQPKIGVSVVNVPCGLNHTGAFKIDKIYSVLHCKFFNENTRNWESGNVTVKADVTALDLDPPEEVKKERKKKGEADMTEFPSLESFFGL